MHRQTTNVRLLILYLCVVLMVASGLLSCKPGNAENSVVIYTSVDQVFSESILKRFEEDTGIKVLPVYDVEAAKTTGLVNRLIAERDHPQADVFWNGEFSQTILLKNEGILAPHSSEYVVDIPDFYRDPDGYWTGFAGRGRVFIVNTDLLSPSDYPVSIFDFLNAEPPAETIGIAYPLFGTTATHAAALYAALGEDEGRAYFQGLRDRGVRVVDGNSVVRDLVVSGQLVMGLTDTDDACSAINKDAPVAIIFPDQDDLGTLIIPNTVALIADGPHPREAKSLIDYLLREETEKLLIESGWSHLPIRPIDVSIDCINNSNVRGMDVSLTDVYNQLERTKRELAEIFIR